MSLASFIPGETAAQEITAGQPRTVLKPARLRKGDKIGLVAPAWLVTGHDLQLAVERVRQLGFKPVYSDKIHGRHGYFSGTDRERADDFNAMIKDAGIKGIIAAGGGYGSTRILDLLDYGLIRENPKVILGFSDNTAIVNAIYQKAGLITFHGPIGRTIHRPYNRAQFENIAMNPSAGYTIESTESDLQKAVADKVFERYAITPGKVQGKLAGGNLTLICSMVGTPYEIDTEKKIVMIEDVDEEPYRIDRMLTQLIAAGLLTKAAAVVFGICRGCDKPRRTKTPDSFTLRQVIEDRIRPLNIPAVYGLSFGHNENNFTFPVGLNAELDTARMTIKLLEAAVESTS